MRWGYERTETETVRRCGLRECVNDETDEIANNLCSCQLVGAEECTKEEVDSMRLTRLRIPVPFPLEEVVPIIAVLCDTTRITWHLMRFALRTSLCIDKVCKGMYCPHLIRLTAGLRMFVQACGLRPQFMFPRGGTCLTCFIQPGYIMCLVPPQTSKSRTRAVVLNKVDHSGDRNPQPPPD